MDAIARKIEAQLTRAPNHLKLGPNQWSELRDGHNRWTGSVSMASANTEQAGKLHRLINGLCVQAGGEPKAIEVRNTFVEAQAVTNTVTPETFTVHSQTSQGNWKGAGRNEGPPLPRQ